VGTWYDPELGRPIAAPLERCAELLGVDLATVHKLAADVEPYLRADGTKVWSLMQLERRLRPQAYLRRRGGYLDRRRNPDDRRRATGRHRRQQGCRSLGAAWLDQRGGRLAGQPPGADFPPASRRRRQDHRALVRALRTAYYPGPLRAGECERHSPPTHSPV
jgi:hypothetical protein